MQRPSWFAHMFERAIVGFYKMRGWTVVGGPPDPRRCVIIAAPHTSNWDFVYYIGGTRQLGIVTSFMAKTALFRWPFGGLMKELGGIPVNRSRSTNSVDAMIAEFKSRGEFMLTIAPEGTRGKVREWKTGFYHIAMGAGVPLVLGMMDYAKKTVGLGPAIWPTGDYEADMAKVREFYVTCTPRHPQMGNPGMIAQTHRPR